MDETMGDQTELEDQRAQNEAYNHTVRTLFSEPAMCSPSENRAIGEDNPKEQWKLGWGLVVVRTCSSLSRNQRAMSRALSLLQTA